MNHPKPEEWVPYVYGEANSAARKELAAHLRTCVQCREEVQTWKRSLHRLDTWKVRRARRRRSELLAPVLQWAAAAVIMLTAGIGIGRATAPKIDTNKLRATLATQIRQDLEEDTAALVRHEVARAATLTLASSQRYTDRVGQQVYGAVKKDVDTIAVNAALGLRNTAEQLVQLADYQEPPAQRTSDQ